MAQGRSMGRLAALLALAASLAPAHADADAPRRILSVDHCADQYVLALVERERIAALSPDATSIYAYFPDLAEGLPQVKPEAEALYTVAPDLIARSWGGGFKMKEAMERLDVPVMQLGYLGAMEKARDGLVHAGKALGAEEKAKALAAGFDAQLARVKARAAAMPRPPRVLYLTAGGFTTGEGTFMDEMIRLAGGENIMATGGRRGFRKLDLEVIVTLKPDLIVTAFFDLEESRHSRWSQARHPVLMRTLADVPSLALPTREIACSAWYNLDAVERVQAAMERAIAPALVEARPKGTR